MVMSDFVDEEPIEVEVDGKIFKIKEPNGPEYDAWTEKYVTILEGDRLDLSIVNKNKGALEFVVDAPYKVGELEFKDAKPEDRLVLLQKLKPLIRNKLIKAINSLLDGSEDVKKK